MSDSQTSEHKVLNRDQIEHDRLYVTLEVYQELENELAELKRQIKDGELIPLEVVHEWGCTTFVPVPDGADGNGCCRESLREFARRKAIVNT